ncbi:MAG: carboxypeptidase regulatory-like domain-containing protein, partial [Bryobacteraceae bacterium]|nr:carboxypeptidase regulatory-like domain-containing protein [Bryobacteraceae bacterium]
QSGHPFSLLMGFNRSGNLNTANLTFHDRPDVNPDFRGNPITGDPRRYWDINYVRMPAANVRGNLGRNTLIGPGLLMIDTALVKPIFTRERTALVLRSEMFNLTNTPNFAPPTGRTAFTNANGGVAANQGVINSTVTSSRQLQFALKLTF